MIGSSKVVGGFKGSHQVADWKVVFDQERSSNLVGMILESWEASVKGCQKVEESKEKDVSAKGKMGPGGAGGLQTGMSIPVGWKYWP